MASKLLNEVLSNVSDVKTKKKVIELCTELVKNPLKESEIQEIAKKKGLVEEPKVLDDPVDLIGETKLNSMLEELADELLVSKEPESSVVSSGGTTKREWKDFGISLELDTSVWSNDIPCMCEYPTATLRIAPKDQTSAPSPMEILAVVLVAEDAFYQNITLEEFVEKQKQGAASAMPFPGMEPKITKEGKKEIGVWQYEMVFDMTVPTPYGAMMTLVMHQLCAMSSAGITYLCQWTGPRELHSEWKTRFFALAEKIQLIDIPDVTPVNSLVFTNQEEKVSLTTPQYWMVAEENVTEGDMKVLVQLETMMLEKKRDVIAIKRSTNDLEGKPLAEAAGATDINTVEDDILTFTYKKDKQTCSGAVLGKYLITSTPKDKSASTNNTDTGDLIRVLKSIRGSTDSDVHKINLLCNRMGMALPGRLKMRTVEHRFGTPSVSCAFDIAQEDGPTLMIAFAEEGAGLSLEQWWKKCEEDLSKQQSTIKTQEYGEISGLKCMTVISVTSPQQHPFMPFAVGPPQLIYNSIVIRGNDTIVFQIECSPELWETYEKDVKAMLGAVKFD